jgi:hypothetical protein
MYNPNQNINSFFNINQNYHRKSYENINKPLSKTYASETYPGSTMNIGTGNELTWRDYRNHIYKGHVIFNFIEQGHKYTFDLDSMLILYLRHIFLNQPLKNPLTRRNLNKVTIKRLHTTARELETQKNPIIDHIKTQIGIRPNTMIPYTPNEIMNLLGP